MIARRYPYQVGKTVQREINANRILFADKHLSEFPLVKASFIHYILSLIYVNLY
jgi:acyl-CoA hydrolase